MTTTFAERISFPSIAMDEATYLDQYAAQFYEWVNREAIRLSPASLPHGELQAYLLDLFRVYFRLRPIGRVIQQPFIVRVPHSESWREPDLLILLNDNPAELTQTMLRGAPDICIEIVSHESDGRDYGEKFVEYERGGVKEYWILDYVRQTARFERLDVNGHYQPTLPDANGDYATVLLPNLRLHVPTLWQTPLPQILQIVASVQAMLV